MSNQQNEIEERTASILLKIKPYLSQDDFSLICWHCGMKTNDFETMPTSEKWEDRYQTEKERF